MLERFAELRPEIVQLGTAEFVDVILDSIPRNAAMNAEMTDVLDVYKKLLTPFKDITLRAQASKHPTLPIVARFLLPILNNKAGNVLAPNTDDGRLQMDVKRAMKQKYEYYYKEEQQDLLYASCFLDPLFAARIDELQYPVERVEAALDLIRSRVNHYLQEKPDTETAIAGSEAVTSVGDASGA